MLYKNVFFTQWRRVLKKLIFFLIVLQRTREKSDPNTQSSIISIEVKFNIVLIVGIPQAGHRQIEYLTLQPFERFFSKHVAFRVLVKIAIYN